MSVIICTDDYFAELFALNIQDFEIECQTTGKKIKFEIMALCDSLKENGQLKETSEEMLSFAADNGLSYQGVRISETKLSGRISGLWADEKYILDVSPTVKEQVGAKVIEISGFSDDLKALIASEKAKEIIDFDDLDQENTTLADIEQLNADAEARAAVTGA